MSGDAIGYLIGGICAVIASVGALLLKRSARGTGEADPNESAWVILSGMNKRLEQAEGKITSLESSLAAEKLHSSTQDEKITALQQALAGAMQVIAGWSTWYDGLRIHWPRYRQHDQPPEPPIVIDTAPIPAREER